MSKVQMSLQEFYSDPTRGVVSYSSDVVGIKNGKTLMVHCDRKWGEYTPSAPEYFDTGWGETVTIPTGYHVKAVKTSVGYAFKTSEFNQNFATDNFLSGGAIGTPLMFGSDHGFTKGDLTFGEIGKPCLQIFFTTGFDTAGGLQGYYWTYRHSQNPTTRGTGYTYVDPSFDVSSPIPAFLKLYGGNINFNKYSGLSAVATTQYAVQFRYYDTDNVQVTYKFHLPTALYTISGNTFTWKGDATAKTGLAFYYKRLGITAIRVWLEKD